MSKQIIDDIRQQIKDDPDNAEYTKKGYEPIFMASPQSRIVIIGQAPGIKAQESGQCFNDQSGDRLREWLGVDRDQFYDDRLFSILPMDFYYPGKGKSGDLPPRKAFKDKWHPQLLQAMTEVELILLVGAYSQKAYLGKSMKKNLTETVKHYKDYLPTYFPLVHPSPLNGRWLKKNPWFEETVVPDLQAHVKKIINRKEGK